jgi:hypothetical protein
MCVIVVDFDAGTASLIPPARAESELRGAEERIRTQGVELVTE